MRTAVEKKWQVQYIYFFVVSKNELIQKKLFHYSKVNYFTMHTISILTLLIWSQGNVNKYLISDLYHSLIK